MGTIENINPEQEGTEQEEVNTPDERHDGEATGLQHNNGYGNTPDENEEPQDVDPDMTKSDE